MTLLKVVTGELNILTAVTGFCILHFLILSLSNGVVLYKSVVTLKLSLSFQLGSCKIFSGRFVHCPLSCVFSCIVPSV